jgi:anthranilate synthase/aminodeoxychorismate synthase-like glutamine amidotransferase
MEAVLIDNNDSFTYNIVELIRKIPQCRLTVIATEMIDIAELAKYEKIIISPGPGLPEEFPVLQRIFDAYHRTKPIFGICLGHEAIAQYFGAGLIQLPAVIHGQPKDVYINNDSILYNNIPSKFTVGLYHSWVVGHKNFPDELQITGYSEDRIIMSFRHKLLNLFGVQYHPESIMTEYGKEILQNFLNIEIS